MHLLSAMNNQFDDSGYAVCPVCCWSVRPADAIGRSDEYVVHAPLGQGAARQPQSASEAPTAGPTGQPAS
jgi:hypothetical protein